tara:strand:- start:737 stop:1354 length:618 start_codon:yes stop_codon:yes gene_type:complete
MKKILNEWKIFLGENSRFEIDPIVQQHLIKILLGRIDYPQVYRYSDGGVAYNNYKTSVESSGIVKQKQTEEAGLRAARKETEKGTPERKKIDRQLDLLGREIGNTIGGLAYYWYKMGGENAVVFIIQQKLVIFLAQLSSTQRENFRNNYKDYLGFSDGEMGVSFPAKLPVKTKMIGDQSVSDVWLVNAGRPLLMDIIKSWANPGG